MPALIVLLVVLVVLVVLMWGPGAGRNRDGRDSTLNGGYFDVPIPTNRAARRKG